MTNNEELMDLDTVHKYLLDLLKEFKMVCEKAEIHWYAIGGSLLGAVRHNGFIPWDDDIDVIISRNQYDKFVNACEHVLNKPYAIVTRENNQYFCQEYIKFCYLEDDGGYSDLAIDVFVLDNVDYNRKIFVELQNWIKNSLYYIKLYKVSRDGHGDYKPHNLLKRWLLFLPTLISYERIDSLLYKVMLAGKDENYVTNWGAFGRRYSEIFRKEWFGNPVEHRFENTSINVPENYHEILSLEYGANYMTPLAKKDRVSHGIKKLHCSSIEVEI